MVALQQCKSKYFIDKERVSLVLAGSLGLGSELMVLDSGLQLNTENLALRTGFQFTH